MNNDLAKIFENLPEIISTDRAAEAVATTRNTVYDWRYRRYRYSPVVPKEMFVKDGARIKVVTSVFKDWWLSRISK